MRKRCLTSCVFLSLALIVAFSCAPATAQTPSGTVELKIFQAGFIVGVEGGSGTLNYQGRSYPLGVGGVSLGATIGASSADLVGEVYNLTSPADIEGIYSATSAGLAVAGGASSASLQNSRGVVLKVHGKQIGLEFSLDLSGLSIKLK